MVKMKWWWMSLAISVITLIKRFKYKIFFFYLLICSLTIALCLHSFRARTIY